jgi:hypothetical protein
MAQQELIARPTRVAAPPPVVALAGWLVPGAGYWLLGQRARALAIGVTIILLFSSGVLMAGVRVVEAPELGGEGRLAAKLLDRPWFFGQVLAGPIGLIGAGASSWLARSPTYAHLVSHARLAEVGTLYTAVAGMLNLMALLDAAWRAGHRRRDPPTRDGG